MILISMLVLIALVLIGVVFLAVTIGGSLFVIIFGDVIVCVVFIVFLIRFLIKRRRKNH